MILRVSLFTRILLWSLLNLAVIGGVLTLLLNLRFVPGPGSLLAGGDSNRLQGVFALILRDLSDSPKEKWESALGKFSDAYGVDFAVFTTDGKRVAGRVVALPAPVRQEIRSRNIHGPFNEPPPREPRRPPGERPGGTVSAGTRPVEGAGGPAGPPNEPGRAGGPGEPGGPGGPREPPGSPGQPSGGRPPDGPRADGRFMMPQAWPFAGPGNGSQRPGFGPSPDFGAMLLVAESEDPDYYWAGIVVPDPRLRSKAGGTVALLARSAYPTGNGLFPEPFPWGTILAIVLALSALLCFPLVRNVTLPLSKMTKASERIARGHFDIRLDDRRTDEIGRLGRAINDMSGRLGRHVQGQKRFLSDVAHELSSPLARIQVGLGILENQVGPASAERLADVMEDAAHLSELVNELLYYSRAEANPKRIQLSRVEVEPVLRRMAERENVEERDIRVVVEPGLAALAEPVLLSRAVANLVRNAIRYAGDSGPIFVKGYREGDDAVIRVQDEGPGVPESSLARLFEPFYRPEDSRLSDTGGAGLGLAIVHTCVTACRGTVSCSNVSPRGFAVTIRLELSISNAKDILGNQAQ